MSNKIYTSVPVPKFPRNVFSLSRPVVGSMRMQRLYPTEILEVVPGDAFNVRQETFLRTAPLVAPPLAKVSLTHHAFFAPAWQLHEKFDDFITGGEDHDFTDHMPYLYVSEIWKMIDGYLNSLRDLLYSNERYLLTPGFLREDHMEEIISVIENFDFSRAVPFSLPEFIPLRVEFNGETYGIGDLSDSDMWNPGEEISYVVNTMKSIVESNLDAWRELNPIAMQGLSIPVNLLPLYPAIKIWSEYFRDENLVDDLWKEFKSDGFTSFVDHVTFFAMFINEYDVDFSVLDWTDPAILVWKKFVKYFGVKKRAWAKDRFTSAQPFADVGGDVFLPLTGTVPVSSSSAEPLPPSAAVVNLNTDGALFRGSSANNKITINGTADLSQVAGGTLMRDVRRAEAVLEFTEADGRFGNRYPENTLAQFGVYTPDTRLPRCQFLGSNRQVVSFGEIAQTSETGDTPLGTLAGKGTSYSPNFVFKNRFTMHGFVVIFTSITVSALYEQGVHPMFSRFDRTEYAWPRYARLGEEPIYVKELSIFGESVETDSVFGYAPRYSTYKSDTGSVHGQMKSTLNYWTFSRKFPLDKDPALSREFVYNDPRRDAFAVTNPYTECFYFEIDWKVRSSRLLPFYGVPSI